MESTSVPRGIHRRTEIVVTESLQLRLNSGIRKGGQDECWPWIGAIRNGYGAIKHQGKVLSTHAVSFVISKGPIPDGHLVTHSCDNKMCCNPSHLYAGTAKSNAREMFDRGLQARHVKGREQPCAKLTDSDVLLIHALHNHLGWSYRKVESVTGFGSSVKSVLSGKSWRHVAIPTEHEAAGIVADWRASLAPTPAQEARQYV